MLCPAPDVNHRFVQRIDARQPLGSLGYQVPQGLCSADPDFT